MNNDLQYGLKGILLTILFLAVLKSAVYIFSYSEKISAKKTVNTVIDKIEPPDKTNEPQYIKGEALFKQNCNACHRISGIVDGPSIKGVEDRVSDKKLLYAWIRDSEKVLKSGNEYFTKQYEQYNKIAMPSFPSLTDADIEAILFYIRELTNSLYQSQSLTKPVKENDKLKTKTVNRK